MLEPIDLFAAIAMFIELSEDPALMHDPEAAIQEAWEFGQMMMKAKPKEDR